MTATSSPGRPILGYADTEAVKLDFDQTPLPVVDYWARRTKRRFNLRGFLILESSPDSYPVVSDRTVSWAENVAIMAWASLYAQKVGLTTWFHMQCIKQG